MIAADEMALQIATTERDPSERHHTLVVLVYQSTRPSDGIAGSASAEDEVQKIVEDQFRQSGHPEWASDYKHPERRMI